MAGIDKITRVLMMYSKLLEGGKIYKNLFVKKWELTEGLLIRTSKILDYF